MGQLSQFISIDRLRRLTSRRLTPRPINLRPINLRPGPHQLRTWRTCAIALLTIVLVGWMLPEQAIARTLSGNAMQPYIDGVVNHISEFTLKNGMKFIVMERHQAPVVSFMTYVNIGSAYEKPGKTGAAHFLEHLAFKGTTQIGTTDYRAEKPILEQQDAVFRQFQAVVANRQLDQANRLQQQFNTISAKAASYVKQNEYGQIVQQAGGVGLNATTSADATRYFYSFPANKLELWMSLESERFLEPIFREFYEEKAVILEERRMRTDNSPIGKMTEQFLQTALPNHPYGRPVIGSEADISNLTRADIQSLFQTYYTPNHIIVAIVGDVNPAEVKQLAEAYFGRYTGHSSAPEVTAVLPTQTQAQEINLKLPSNPWYLESYQRPALNDPDNAVYETIASILVDGRTSRLYKALVEQQLALNVNVSPTFPGNRYSNLMLLYAQTAAGHTVEDVARAMQAEIDRLKTERVSEAELDRVKRQAKAGLLQTLASNEGMASLLPEYEAKTGSWRNLFEQLKAIEAVTPEDVQRVAEATFQPQKQTIGRLLSQS